MIALNLPPSGTNDFLVVEAVGANEAVVAPYCVKASILAARLSNSWTISSLLRVVARSNGVRPLAFFCVNRAGL